jgi:hypothetical protein
LTRACHCYACEREGQHADWCEVHEGDRFDHVELKPGPLPTEPIALDCDCGQREGKRQKLDVPHPDSVN